MCEDPLSHGRLSRRAHLARYGWQNPRVCMCLLSTEGWNLMGAVAMSTGAFSFTGQRKMLKPVEHVGIGLV